jgi:hypothetical protein
VASSRECSDEPSGAGAMELGSSLHLTSCLAQTGISQGVVKAKLPSPESCIRVSQGKKPFCIS